jgi:hypothetical protein
MGAKSYAAAMQILSDARYLEFRDSYSTERECEILATDNPTVTIVVSDANGPKTITHYRGCRGFARQEALTQLEDNLDTTLKTRSFIH